MPASRRPARLASPADFDRLLGTTARLATVFIAILGLVVALQAAHAILAPIALAIVVGLVFGPVADQLENRSVPPALSGALIVLTLLLLFGGSMALLAVPLSEWVGRLPAIWQKFQTELLNWREPLQSIAHMQDQLKTALGGGAAMEVTVQDGNQVIDIAMLAPAVLGDILIFLVSLYFFLATRDRIRISILSLCTTRRMRWRTAHVFHDVESRVSRFLLTVTTLNVCVGIAVTLATWALGLPSPLLWGAFAFILNYVPYVGQAVMIAILLAVGFATQPNLPWALAPVGCYLVITLIEGQLAFPQFVGRTMEMNPFLIFVSIIFWIWVWGPVGSLMAVPTLLIAQSAILNIVPTREVAPRRPVRRTANMTDRDVILANAARAIRERLEAEAAAKAEAEAAREAAAEAKAAAEREKAAKAEAEKAAAEKPAAPARRRRAPSRRPPKAETAPAT
jgi:predicted PurR-regulated permease PerM